MNENIKQEAIEMLEALMLPLDEYCMKHYGKSYIEALRYQGTHPLTLEDLIPIAKDS